jgi:Mn2+/Fe2+ NRAMP family transporter
VPPAGKNPIACHFGPGIVLAGTSIGSGEWLFGPAVTAQYGAALLSILFQGFVDRLSLAVLLIFWT